MTIYSYSTYTTLRQMKRQNCPSEFHPSLRRRAHKASRRNIAKPSLPHLEMTYPEVSTHFDGAQQASERAAPSSSRSDGEAFSDCLPVVPTPPFWFLVFRGFFWCSHAGVVSYEHSVTDDIPKWVYCPKIRTRYRRGTSS